MGDPALEPTTLESSLRKFVAPEITAEAYRAIDSYQATGAGQVSFEIGDTIHVLDKLEDGTLNLQEECMLTDCAGNERKLPNYLGISWYK